MSSSLRFGILALVCLMLSMGVAQAQQEIHYFADSSETIITDSGENTVFFNNVSFVIGSSVINCDTMVYIDDVAKLWGNVVLNDPEYTLRADSVQYEPSSTIMTARGDYVEIWSKDDSLFMVGTYAIFFRDAGYFKMKNRPTVYLGYPDTVRMIEVIADTVVYEKSKQRAKCVGQVVINSKDISAKAGLAYMFQSSNRLELYEKPVVMRKGSTISGENIIIESNSNVIRRIEVTDSAYAEFEEPTDSTEKYFDYSQLKGEQMTLDFERGELSLLTCIEQAYCWYKPSALGGNQQSENEASGDTIRFFISNNQLGQVDIIGGALGTYVVTTVSKQSLTTQDSLDQDTITQDTLIPDTINNVIVDSIDYRGEEIHYFVADSLITIDRSAHVTSGEIALEAAKIALNTKTRIIEAWSASLDPPPISDTTEVISEYEPNIIPVILKDGAEEFYGDYLEYSIETEKGRIEQSKSGVQQGIYYGQDAFRAKKEIFYVSHGRYTPCDINYLHFYSRNMKFIQGEKLIAKPVVLFIDKLPVMILPYYVFPLQSGRHSGFTPFTFGNIEQGDKYIRNVGYYWAASKYWDIRGALDYYEKNSTVNFYGKLTYKKRYIYDGSISGNFTRETSYFSSPVSQEVNDTRWNIKASHKHEFSPDFKLSASGSYQADPSFYKDYSANLEERLNRTIRSKINFTKRFGKSVSLSGRFSHDVNLDTEIRTTIAPSLGISVPLIRPFGVGKKNADGKLDQSWYNNLTVTYRPNVTNYSKGTTVITDIYDDTTIVFDSNSGLADTTIITNADTSSYRSRKKYTKVDHSLSVNFPTKLAKYITLTPNFRYSENWYNIYETDQSEALNIIADQYRVYGYSLGTGLSTKLYGTVMPNIGGLIGFRQVITPSLSYNFRPKIDDHPTIKSYAGGGAGSSRQSSSIGISVNHIYQAKVAIENGEKNLDLLTVNHSTSYDFENDSRPWGGLSTSFNSKLMHNVNLYGNMTHSFYDPVTDEIKLTSPYLESFSFNASMNLNGNHFLFDEEAARKEVERGADSASQIGSRRPTPTKAGSGAGQWNASMTYSYRESGRNSSYTKSAFLRFNLRFKLTPQTSVSYSQTYNFERGRTVNNQISIVRILKCWTGNFYWVPVGSNRGYGFRLFVTGIPAIKIDNSQTPLNSGYFQSLR